MLLIEMLPDIFPLLVAAVVVAVIVVLKVTEMRMNRKSKANGEKPLTEEQQIVNVIDWTKH